MKTTNLIHNKIIERCKNGDSQAQFELYKLYYKAMYNTALRIVQNTYEAEDIMQEAFLAAFDKIATFKAEVTFGAWLKRITVNKALDALRRKNKLFEIEELKPYQDKISDNCSEDDFENTQMNVEKIKNAMPKLAQGYRIVLNLFYFEGYDHREIAQMLQISEATSRSQLARAKKKLIELFNH